MRYVLENQYLRTSFDSYGAELRSIQRITDGREYMWQANPEYWNRTSPILFPFVGRLHNLTYIYQDHSYTMMQHGFARDQEFQLVEKEPNQIFFKLTDTEYTHHIYPFSFELYIGYILSGNELTVSWQVTNPNQKMLHFAIGAHPAFNHPCGEPVPKGSILLHGFKELQYQKLDQNRFCLPQKHVLKIPADGIWHFDKSIFSEDVYIFPDHQLTEVSLVDSKGIPYLTLESQAPLTGIWSPPGKDAPFICIEPWYGRCDGANTPLPLPNKDYINTLSVGETFTATYKIKIHL